MGIQEMTAFKCGNCREVHVLNSKARFCPNCGSSSLLLVLNELAEPAQRESLGVVKPPLETSGLMIETDKIPVEALVPKDERPSKKSGRTSTKC